MEKMSLLINEDGSVSYVYDDRLAGAFAGEEQETTRVSHVEPYDGSGGAAFAARHPGTWWTADMGPVDGPVLGPFRTRQEALDAEREWLRRERGL